MVMKKASDGDSPLLQGAEKSFWTLLISGQRRWWLVICFWKIDRPLGFSRRGEYIGGGAASGSGQGGYTHWWRGPGAGRAALGCACPWLPSVSALDFGFCFVQFQEYILCSFSETQK
jgi:hypothetical protein